MTTVISDFDECTCGHLRMDHGQPVIHPYATCTFDCACSAFRCAVPALTCTCDTGHCFLHNAEPPLPPQAAGILDTINGLLDEVDVAAGKQNVQVIVRMPHRR